MDELPVLKKCCFCIPLRYGLLTWGYVKLIIALKVLAFYIIIMIAISRFISSAIIAAGSVILATEIILHIIFIVGAHKKNVKLLRVYYYYAIFMWAVTIIIALVCTALLIEAMSDNDSTFQKVALYTLDGVGFSCSIVIQTFLLLALRSEIIKLRSNCPYRFVKNDNDPEGNISTVQYDEDIFKENGPEHSYDRERS